ncbi:hypothetical protein LXA43DRAFT_974290 [Ganoderma leucocontextum]|nr:hypothetical protein LXA43DRAFT_974290 [Ganoderma leucocontextum]
MGHVKNFAPGKSPKKLLDPPPPSFLRPPPPGLPYAGGGGDGGAFPVMLLLSKGATLDRGFPYVAPECGAGVVPHPFVAHDVNEQDWRRFLHDLRVAGSLSPLNRVASGLAPLALPGVGIILGFFVVKGVDSVMRRTKKGPVSQLIDHWNHSFFHPRCIHIGLTQGPPKDARGKRDKSQGSDKNWRLIISYRPYVPA